MADSNLRILVTATDRASGVLRDIGLVAATALATRGIAGIENAISGALSSGIAYNQMLADTAAGYETLFGSADAAQKKIAEFSAFAARTPLQLPDVLKMGQAFANAKVPIDNLVPTMRTVTSAIAGTGAVTEDRTKGITLAITQMLNKGKVSAEEMNQIGERGLPGWDILAAHFGKTTAQVMKDAEQGKISGKDFIDALNAAAEDRGWVDRLEKSSRTFTGAVSNIQDVWNRAQADLTKPIFDEATKGLVKLADFLQSADFQAPIAGLSAGIGEAIKILKEDLAGFVSEGDLRDFAEGALENFLKLVTGADFAARAIGTTLGNLGGVVGGFAGMMGAAFEKLSVGIAAWAYKVGAGFRLVGDVLGAAGRSIEAFATGWGEAFGSMIGRVGTLGEVVGAAVTGRFGDIGGIIASGMEKAAASAGRARDAWLAQGAVIANIGDAAEHFGDRIRDIDRAHDEMVAGIAPRARASAAEWATASKKILDGFGQAAQAAAEDTARIRAAFDAASERVRAHGAAVDALGGKYDKMGGDIAAKGLTQAQLDRLADLAEREDDIRRTTAKRIADLARDTGRALAEEDADNLARIRETAEDEAGIKEAANDRILGARADLTKRLSAIDADYADQQEDFARRAFVIGREADEQRAAAHQRMLDTIADAEQRNADQIDDIRQRHADRIAELTADAGSSPRARMELVAAIAKEQRDQAREIASAQKSQARDMEDVRVRAAREQEQALTTIAREEGEKRESLEVDRLKAAEEVAEKRKAAEQTLADSIFDINKDLGNRLRDLYKADLEARQEYLDDRFEMERDAAEKLADIEAGAVEALDDVARARAKVTGGTPAGGGAGATAATMAGTGTAAAVAGTGAAPVQLVFNGSVTFPLPGANDTVPAWYIKIVETVRAEQAAAQAGRR